ncbi:MAG TPA: trypsin-like peptidase domain-containing protein [Anaerolineae bacterium]|nr:trypsin-like peptidase domain-containing protein [Anaerolineae bacterium]HOR01045.1 trypsin-like peptidase domain-containing protein [Anaerolineae bacterium]HPL29738.1 trypsin-like peptidase domain-containing protein [Anaerolineae bacterium]
MSKKYWAVTASLGCVTLLLLAAVIAIPLFVVPLEVKMMLRSASVPATSQIVSAPESAQEPAQAAQPGQAAALTTLYRQANPGIVSINVATVRRGTVSGAGSGSGFIYDDQGHIITNHHVVEGATDVTVVFYDGRETEATVAGTDPNSDLAVVKVAQLPEGIHALPLGDSDQVAVGESVIAIGNPFGLGNSMSAGIVSAVGRTIDSGATPFSIPRAIQTDAAINPGNSGGPLLNLQGQVIGVNAQIATSGIQAANAGVGFAIPSNTVRLVAPVLIEKSAYAWPWLGITGGSVNLSIMKANGLSVQQGAYVDKVSADSPAGKAGLRGSSTQQAADSLDAPVGGDVIIAIDDKPVVTFDDLLFEIASRKPGDQVRLTIVRGRQRMDVTATLAPRPRQ